MNDKKRDIHMSECRTWEPIEDFRSPGEFKWFTKYVEQLVANGTVMEISADPNYSRGTVTGGRWFRCKANGEVWRLVAPDLPYRGEWSRVVMPGEHAWTHRA